MKKIYTLLTSLILISGVSKAQLSLTQTAYEPVIGNVDLRKDFDSTSTLPTNTGTAQVWNFTTLASTTNAPVPSTYTTPASVPGGTAYPTATIAQDNGTFFKSSANLFEMLGLETSTVSLSFSNPAIIASWPIAYGYSNTDPVAGNVSTGFGNGTFTGTITTNALGTGTLQLPNAMTYTNCLMLKTRLFVNATLSLGSATLIMTTYQYYHSSQKFPIVTITYTDLQSIALNNSDAVVTLNNNIFAGINELTLDNSYSVYPNPATDMVNIDLTNETHSNVSVVVMNNLGQIVKSFDFGNSIAINHQLNTSDLPKGMYHITTSIGGKSATKKLIIQ
jgi:hypothetical protein